MVQWFIAILLLMLPHTSFAVDAYVGKGCTTAFSIDVDCDGYGVGAGLLGFDADDNDAAINTTASVDAQYGSITSGSNVVANLKTFFCLTRGYCNIDDIWFVSDTGDNTTGVKNDITHPFRYLGYTAGVKGKTGLGAGDLLVWRGGTYASTLGGENKDQIDVTYSMPVGTAASPIIFAGFPGEKPIFSGAYDKIAGTNTTVRDLWYVYDGFQLGDSSTVTAAHGITFSGAREVVWRNLDIYHNNAVGMRVMSYVSWPTVQVPLKNMLLERSIIKGDLRTLGTATHNIYWGHAIPKNWNNPATGCRVKDIISYNNNVSFDGMQFNGHFEDWSVEGSQFHSASNWGFSAINGPSNGKFVSNLIYNNDGPGLKVGKYVGFVAPNLPNGESNADNNLFANNTIWTGSISNGTKVGGAPSTWNPLYLYTEVTCDNVLAGGGYTDPVTSITYEPGQQVCPDLTTTPTGNIFRNNIIVASGSGAIRADQRKHLENNIFDHNLLFRTDGSGLVVNLKNNTETWAFAQFDGDTSITASNNINANPLFLDVSNTYATTPGLFNFRLTNSSPAKSTGVTVLGVTTDIIGANYGSPPSIGAYEYGIYSPPGTINGTCGSSNGLTFSQPPTANLCSTGTPSAVTGQYNWTCNGANGGTNASCSASYSAGGGSTVSYKASFRCWVR